MYYCLQIRVARCRRRFHLKLLLAHGFLQTFPSFIQCVNAIGNYYVKICLICSEIIHIWLENTVVFYQAFDDKYKQPRQIIWYRDHWTSNEVDKQTMKCLSRVLKCTAIFFFHWKKILFLLTLTLGHCRLCRWQWRKGSADTHRIVYRLCGISPYYDVLPIEINKIKYDIMFSSFPKLLPIITA